MSLAFGHPVFLLPPSSLHRRTIASRQCYRARKRRRLKPLTVHNQLNPTASPFDNLLHSLISHFPSANSLSYIAPTLGLASGLALFFFSNSPKPLPNPKTNRIFGSDVGEWILFTSATPFNRFITLRCPSIYFPGNELLENVNERLVKEERHYVKLNCGRMIQPVKSDGDENMVYQRFCVGAEDGGVLSLDWPANLDFNEERGLDITMLIVPGTEEGSNERKIRVFVCDCLRRGIFPVVMNPRGCAGSPLITARLFTAADSDDISTVVQYINKKRPWTTLMAVGWGYGANMLTKYLAEFGERTPLMAATCIDNPFDLEEAMRSTVYHTDFDQRHTNGLIKILQCNKEIFQGRGKGFDVEKALSASSTREFERAISMVSHGFDTIEDFYEKSSTRDVVGRVKVPVLFIQNDDGRVPLFSIPRGAIAENPYTSLLLCAYSPPSKIMDDTLTFSWCQHLTLEWLTAVELGLLKGRHPLLKDIDVTINPSKGLELVESRTSNKRARVDMLLDLNSGDSTNPPLKMFNANDTATTNQSRSTKDIGTPVFSPKGLQQEDNDLGRQSGATVDTVVEEGTNDRGQVLQTAQVVMNMLDMTMPDTLSEEQKKKVLSAFDRGETLIKALEDAVPEDVRGKITTAASGILQDHGSNLKLDKLISLGRIPDLGSGLNLNVRPRKTNDDEYVHSVDQKKMIDDPGDGSGKGDHNSDWPPEGMELEKQSSENSQKPNDTDMDQSTSNHGRNGPDLEKMNMKGAGSSSSEELSGGSTTHISDRENVPERDANQETSIMVEGPGGADEIIADQKKVEIENHKGESDLMEENSKQKNDLSNDQNNQNETSEAYRTEDKSSAPSPTSDTQVMENEAENNQRKEEKGPMSNSSQDTGDSPRFSVSQALDALTGFDDSTQVAVNSVFHVIEGMLDQLEVDRDNEIEVNNEKNKSQVNGVDKVKEQHYEHGEQNSNSSDTKNTRSQLGAENEISMVPAPGQLPAGNSLKCLSSSSENLPNNISIISSENPLYREYLKRYLYLKTRNAKPPDMDKLTALYYLDSIPEGQWKLLKRIADDSASVDEYAINAGGFRENQTKTRPRSKDTDNIVEPSYVIFDSGKSQDQNEEFKDMNIVNDNAELGDTEFEDSKLFIKNIILECLNVEVGRRAIAADMEELELKLAREIEFVANAVSMDAGRAKMYMRKGNDDQSEKLGSLNGENIIKAISSALQDTQYLRRVLPVGVAVGASLAALKKFFNVATLGGNAEKHQTPDLVDESTKSLVQAGEKGRGERLLRKDENKDDITSSIGEEDIIDLEASENNSVMVGAVTAALGASALLAHQPYTGTDGTLNEPLKEKENSKEPSKLDEMHDNTQNNIVTSLAEKAMSVASPVVPMKEDGEVDHERLVSMLAELGQKGGMLKLVGKVALLWGGIRGILNYPVT
ncbi:embryogenesis-associated protein emb8 [Phtheirospermum japonicum]|uniref:Embryogenesis-associated protein emb8 n=1 Tax=Phtheirospermum japonicum TaxID=374723 RepID=A0A830BKB6_9LAMI|nr:embryogenesis-associated protein emb8 [Phtheirospermum japonicum]